MSTNSNSGTTVGITLTITSSLFICIPAVATIDICFYIRLTVIASVAITVANTTVSARRIVISLMTSSISIAAIIVPHLFCFLHLSDQKRWKKEHVLIFALVLQTGGYAPTNNFFSRTQRTQACAGKTLTCEVIQRFKHFYGYNRH